MMLLSRHKNIVGGGISLVPECYGRLTKAYKVEKVGVEEALKKGYAGPFIMLTGSDNPDLYKKFSEKGVYDYILKNELSPSLIDRCITYTLKRKKIEGDLRKEKEFISTIIEEVPYMILGISENKIVFLLLVYLEQFTFAIFWGILKIECFYDTQVNFH